MSDFLTKETVDRVKRYDRNMELVKGRHWELFENPWKVKGTGSTMEVSRDWERRRKRSELIYIILNMAGLIAKVSADFLFLEPLDVSLKSLDENVDQESDQIKEGQKKLKDIWKRNNMDTALYESALTNAVKGDSVWKINRVDSKAEIVEMDPENWIPETGRNRRNYIAHNFLTPIRSDELWYVLVERHEVGVITNELRIVKNGKSKDDALVINAGVQIGEPVSDEIYDKVLTAALGKGKVPKKEVKTDLEFMPVVHIPNIRFQTDTFGTSDFDDLETLFMELNMRVSQNSRVLDKHGDPKMFGPRLTDDNGEIDRDDLEYIEIAEGDTKPEYIIWQAALDHSQSQINFIVDSILMLSETSKAAFGMTDGAVESAAALKVKLIRTLAKIARKRLYYDPGLKNILEYAMVIESGESTADSDDVELAIKWPSGLPEFVTETINNETKKLTTGAQSLEATIGNLNPEFSQEEIDAEIDRILEDQNASSRMVVGNNPQDFQNDGDDQDPIGATTEQIAAGDLG